VSGNPASLICENYILNTLKYTFTLGTLSLSSSLSLPVQLKLNCKKYSLAVLSTPLPEANPGNSIKLHCTISQISTQA
jgi:hypothetical protein